MSANDSNNISRNDWTALEAITDEEIDYSEIPSLTNEFFANATLRIPTAQAHNFVQLDAEIIERFQTQEKECKTLINTVLRQYIESSGK